jgi:hypothetical protein
VVELRTKEEVGKEEGVGEEDLVIQDRGSLCQWGRRSSSSRTEEPSAARATRSSSSASDRR